MYYYYAKYWCLVNEIDSIWFSRAAVATVALLLLHRSWMEEQLARSRFVTFYAPMLPCDFTSPSSDAKSIEAKKTKWNFSTPKRGVQRVYCASHACAPLHRLRIGAETVLRDKKLSAVLEKATTGVTEYRLRGAYEVFIWNIYLRLRPNIRPLFSTLFLATSICIIILERRITKKKYKHLLSWIEISIFYI